MREPAKTTSKKKLLEKVKQIIIQERQAVFIALAMFAGAVCFCLLAQKAEYIKEVDWRLLAITSVLFGLPNAYTKLKRSKAPYVIMFARGFREGFLSIPKVAPNVSRWITKAFRLWRNLKRK